MLNTSGLKELIEDNADMFAGLAPSNFCYSNIGGGYGIFGGVSIVETDWITPEFIEKVKKIQSAVIQDLAFAYIFGFVASISNIVSIVKSRKKKTEIQGE